MTDQVYTGWIKDLACHFQRLLNREMFDDSLGRDSWHVVSNMCFPATGSWKPFWSDGRATSISCICGLHSGAIWLADQTEQENVMSPVVTANLYSRKSRGFNPLELADFQVYIYIYIKLYIYIPKSEIGLLSQLMTAITIVISIKKPVSCIPKCRNRILDLARLLTYGYNVKCPLRNPTSKNQFTTTLEELYIII